MSTYSQPFFSSSTWKRGGVYGCANYRGDISRTVLEIEVKLLLSANRKSYVPRRWGQQRMTLSDLEWPFYGSASCAISAVAELFVDTCCRIISYRNEGLRLRVTDKFHLKNQAAKCETWTSGNDDVLVQRRRQQQQQ